MEGMRSFDEVLEAADNLTLDEQTELVDILSRRMNERRRRELKQDVDGARREFQKGQVHPASPDELIQEILA